MSFDSTIHRARSLIKLTPSHRTIPEQFVGLGIYLLICLGALAAMQGFFPFQALLSAFTYQALNFTYFLFLGTSMWFLWRAHSLRKSKLELSLFLSQFLFLASWCVSFSSGKVLLAIVALLLLWCNTLISALLYWKKERFSGLLLVFPAVWVLYLAALNMTLC